MKTANEFDLPEPDILLVVDGNTGAYCEGRNGTPYFTETQMREYAGHCVLGTCSALRAAEDRIKALRIILTSVEAKEFGGIHCRMANGLNWFEARDEAMLDA